MSFLNFSKYFKHTPKQTSKQEAKPLDNFVTDERENKLNKISSITDSTIDMSKRVGMDIMSRLTQRTNKALMLALNKAKELKLQYVDSEHLLWGLLHDGSIYQLISECKAVPTELQSSLEKMFKTDNFSGQPVFSPRVKRVLEISLSVAKTLGYDFIAPEHLLLSLSKEGEGVAAQILNKFNLKLEVLNQKVTGKKIDSEVEEKKKTSTLEQYTEDLTAKAKNGELDPVVGRSWEIERIIHILSRRTKNNPVLIGDAGVGKTAIVEGLALRIAKGDVPETILHKRILSLDLMSLIAGARHRGEFEERLKNLIKEVKQAAGAIILFIDEMHNMVGAGSGGEGTMDASNILKPSLARGEMQTVGTTTVTEYRKYIEKDPALERRFQPIQVLEPSAQVAIQMLLAIRDKYEAFHRVKISDEAIDAAVRLSQRYIGDRFLPDKAVDLIDEAAASVRLPAISLPEEIRDTGEKIKKIKSEILEAKKINDRIHLNTLENTLEEANKSLISLSEQYSLKKSTTTNTVTPEIIADIVSRWTNIPVTRLSENESRKLLDLEKIIHQRLINQDTAVTAVSEAVRRGRAGLKSSKRPIGSFIFLGPTGVGKTELAKALAEILFNTEEMIIRLDMTEYMEKHEVAKLIGAPPGYVGYEEGGQLTEAVRRRPYSVVLFDEIEKAHPDVFNILIQLLDDGRLTDNKGHTISFKNTIVICTSNLGSNLIQEELMKTKSADSATPNNTINTFSTYTLLPSGQPMITAQNYYFIKDENNVWQKKELAEYFKDGKLSSGTFDFPVGGFDVQVIFSGKIEKIYKDDKVWTRLLDKPNEWKSTTLLDEFQGHMVINSVHGNLEEQLPAVKINTYAVLRTGEEMITAENRYWKRENANIKDWETGALSDYPGVDPAKLLLPTDMWNAHFFDELGQEAVLTNGSLYLKSDLEWKKHTVADYLPETFQNVLTTEKTEGNLINNQKNGQQDAFAKLSGKLMEQLRKFFRPELLNRFDEVVIFKPLTREHMAQIVDLQIKGLTKLLEEKHIGIKVSLEAKLYLAAQGYDLVFGARPLRRTIQRLVENKISSMIIKNEISESDTLTVDLKDNELIFQVEKAKVSEQLTENSEERTKNIAQVVENLKQETPPAKVNSLDELLERTKSQEQTENPPKIETIKVIDETNPQDRFDSLTPSNNQGSHVVTAS